MHASLADAAILSLVLLVFVAGIRVWAEIVRRRRQGMPVVAYEPRRPVPWTAAEIALILAVYLLLQVAAVPVVFGLMGLEVRHVTEDGAESKDSTESKEIAEADETVEPKAMDPQRYTAMLLANVLGNVLTAAATVALLRLRAAPTVPITLGGRFVAALQPFSGATWSDLGLSRPTVHDLQLGLAAFAGAVIPVFGLQAVLVQFTEKRHPIVEMLEQHMNFGLMAVSVLSAVVVAPFVEELLFRVALQGWLERVQMLAKSNAIEPVAATSEGAPMLEQQPTSSDRLMPWPIVISSLTFALAHLGNGPDPIPLFFLALALGYLYQRTHRLWPSLVVHATLNSCSLLMLWLQTARE
jgi:membrane protease YdiL (CAAX protease family)